MSREFPPQTSYKKPQSGAIKQIVITKSKGD
jgi:hypothetical protein